MYSNLVYYKLYINVIVLYIFQNLIIWGTHLYAYQIYHVDSRSSFLSNAICVPSLKFIYFAHLRHFHKILKALS